jgi:hypothetical protein
MLPSRTLDVGEQIASARAFAGTLTTGWPSTSCAPRADRERYVGKWLPEPIIIGGQPVTAGSLSLAMLVR